MDMARDGGGRGDSGGCASAESRGHCQLFSCWCARSRFERVRSSTTSLLLCCRCALNASSRRVMDDSAHVRMAAWTTGDATTGSNESSPGWDSGVSGDVELAALECCRVSQRIESDTGTRLHHFSVQFQSIIYAAAAAQLSAAVPLSIAAGLSDCRTVGRCCGVLQAFQTRHSSAPHSRAHHPPPAQQLSFIVSRFATALISRSFRRSIGCFAALSWLSTRGHVR